MPQTEAGGSRREEERKGPIVATNIVITIRNVDDELIAVDQIPVATDELSDKLVAEVKVVDVPARPRRKRERSPLHPDALVLADLRVGMHIRVNHKDNPSYSYCAMVVGSPTTNEYDNIIIPLVKLGDEPDYVMGYPEDMGLMRYITGSKIWNRSWYTTVAD